MKIVEIIDQRGPYSPNKLLKGCEDYFMIAFKYGLKTLLAYPGEGNPVVRRRNKIFRGLKTRELKFAAKPIRGIAKKYSISTNGSRRHYMWIDNNNGRIYTIHYYPYKNYETIEEVFDLLSRIIIEP
jgi:hypothetical protein